MSLPIDPQSPPAPGMQQPYGGRSGSGSVGPVIGVLVVIIVFAVVAVAVGRLCSGKTIMGYGHFDLETWAETKCSSCIDGRISPPLPPQPPPPIVNVSAPVATLPAVQTLQETKQEEAASQNPPPNA